jgi:uncharacterized lipoprotein YddW (UPF0748 family)
MKADLKRLLSVLLTMPVFSASLALTACGTAVAPTTKTTGAADGPATQPLEVRGTWITTTANTAIATPEDTARTMKRLREIGINTVYVEVWKNGYTQYPSEVLKRTIGHSMRPIAAPQDPSDPLTQRNTPARDLLQEMLIEGHRNGLVTIAWFEYGFMAAHKSTNPHLRRMKPEWLSRDISGNEVAPNGFVWMNPLHPEARQFLLDLVLESIDKYDLDGVQLDDRIVWPYITMGYDDYTKKVYAQEHNGAQPPSDHKDLAWMRWRAEKVNEYAKRFVQEVRAKRPNLIISLSPAVYPWSWENYLLEWPQWAAWTAKDINPNVSANAKNITPRWDEFIPQVYRFSYPAFEKTWLEQVEHMKTLGANRQGDLLAGIRVVGEGKDSTWEDLQKSIELTRKTGAGGHVHWFSRGVLDLYPNELKSFYGGFAPSPRVPNGWRQPSIPLFRDAGLSPGAGKRQWFHPNIPRGQYQLIGSDGKRWQVIQHVDLDRSSTAGERTIFFVDDVWQEVELIIDRRLDRPRKR